MIRVITIDDSKKANKVLLEIVEEFSKKNKGILMGEKALMAIEEVEDEILAKKMKAALKSGFLNKSEKKAFLKKHGIVNAD
jgi:hypothetical protein